MKWTTAGTPGGIDDNTGYPIEGTTDEQRSTPCRFHLGGVKVFKNQDNTEVKQIGTIRLDPGIELPVFGDTIEVIGQFTGKVMDVYKAQLSSRIDV